MDSKFISQLWKGEKLAFNNLDVNHVALPYYSELKMANLIEQAKNDIEVKQYLHDDFATKKKPSRQFLINIIGTVYPDYFKDVIEG